VKNLPVPISDYEFCQGESPEGTHVCAYRDVCKRFIPKGYRVYYVEFWKHADDDCKHFESKKS